MNLVYFISNRTTSVIKGIVAVILGAFLLFYPSFTSGLIIKLIAAFLIAAGLSALLFAYRSNSSGGKGNNIPVMVWINVIIYVVFGLLVFIYPNFFLGLIAFLFGGVLIVCGVMQMVGLYYASKSTKINAGLYILPTIIALSGFVLFFAPGFSTRVLTMIFGGAILLYGVSELLAVWNLRAVKYEKYEEIE
ncbi:MAG: DUF308 domain-containing protein [Bacteroidia bacterium]|nr:DUF308 domain-containing protein [Bacteroidia bacterium]